MIFSKVNLFVEHRLSDNWIAQITIMIPHKNKESGKNFKFLSKIAKLERNIP